MGTGAHGLPLPGPPGGPRVENEWFTLVSHTLRGHMGQKSPLNRHFSHLRHDRQQGYSQARGPPEWLTHPRTGPTWGLGHTGCQFEAPRAGPGSKISGSPSFRTLYGAIWAKNHP